VLALRDAPVGDDVDETTLEVSREVAAGLPVYQRDVKARVLVRRGQVIEALVRDAFISASQKVEVLEDGAINQQVRVRNLNSKREFRGKVQDEKTVLVSL
jgi:flagella basal body P-ring formation protein FlgA